ncbi:hypothetical protein [Pantoea stewartii]|uniref:Uncharacterized protein n=1 Tax=Pantoea stewartii TaxID=66269 RepID=A0AB34VHU3_9GAMM|nr:hypothetical protein [Pantoea stewartii]KTS72204.1 hypothetical protein RSA30_15360 [Pantoea stewartii]KTS97632.1 hypothetical protein RSA13_11060 [Pantoea stewartii]KTT04930.1 hypothetical protein RSA36_21820 [Pantoea stewartii]
MGRFSDIRPVNITHKGFDRSHNGQYFQTKDLDMEYGKAEYCIFNGQLYRNVSDAEAGEAAAVPVPHTGTVDIYTSVKECNQKLIYWVEYRLEFEAGKLMNVELMDKTLQEDLRDLSKLRPAKPVSRVEVTISVNGLSGEKQRAFAASLTDDKLSRIREILGEPTASIFFPAAPVVKGNNDPFLRFPSVMTVASVVQGMEDLRGATDENLHVVSPTGDRIVLIDELHSKYGPHRFSPDDRQSE